MRLLFLLAAGFAFPASAQLAGRVNSQPRRGRERGVGVG
jgi:hypothetical protein